MSTQEGSGVLIIYTGGTIGCFPRDRRDPNSPLVPASDVKELLSVVPAYDSLDSKVVLDNSKIRIGTHSFHPPLDSSDIEMSDWVEIARCIEEHYDIYEGFVILHGTDTLAYTSSALSFLLENLSKPVIVTGSQRPIGQPRSDAVQNLISSIEIAAAHSLGAVVVPEVCVFFRDQLLRGCRATKQSANSYSGFSSPNFRPLGTAGERVEIDESALWPASTQRLYVRKISATGVASVDIFPGMDSEVLDSVLSLPNLQGIVLNAYGAGNAPTSHNFLEVVGRAVENGKLILITSQCLQGEVELGLYDASSGLLSKGVVSGLDLTREAALTKLMVLLGEGDAPNIAEVADRLQINLRGEQRCSVFFLHFRSGSFDSVDSEDGPSHGDPCARVLPARGEMVAGRERFRAASTRSSVLRIIGLEIPDCEIGIIRFSVFIDLPSADSRTPTEGHHYVGEVQKTWKASQGEESAVLPITKQVRDFVDNSHRNTLTIVNTSGFPFSWRRLEIACFADC